MDINSLTIGEAKQLASFFSAQNVASEYPPVWEIGKVYIIRTVTMIDLGRVVQVTPQWIVLEDACWIADTGRWADALKGKGFSETEPFPDGRVIVGAGAIVDAALYTTVVRSQK